MKSNDARELAFIEVAANGVANVVFEGGQIIGFGENRSTESARRVPAFVSFFDEENELIHRERS